MNTEEDEFKRIEREALRRVQDDDDDTQVYADTLTIVYQSGFVDGKKAAQRKWVGLTWEDMPEEHAGDSNFLSGARWAEARLKERNHD